MTKEQEKKPVTPAPDTKKLSPKKSKGVPGTTGDKKKRTGSAELSESGNEKARKKPKKIQAPPMFATSAASANARASGSGQDQKLVKLKVPPEKFSQITSLTPSSVSQPQQQGKKRKAMVEGSGSGDDTSGEMSDSNKKPRVKMLSSGRALSPPSQGTGSRRGSPAPGANPRAGSPASRAGSPADDVPSGTEKRRRLVMNEIS